ncbi:mechanosensitive ion channel domain-containing protein [sulfur-oxidizing endosymbiont of Gigantopelta aegis]|uniref:mechanosensitive ion channel domain-containing protein n=1 Tax=sulfur-oxidizing endosymbiont of Gigantopelta aegis TaxID=2794934 RepID=UPI001BE4A28D|nr:mechanosensitive ion channel domain-containing protein [sulfur-oxidizing endosymbiont of Gigantopelta aegis]
MNRIAMKPAHILILIVFNVFLLSTAWAAELVSEKKLTEKIKSVETLNDLDEDSKKQLLDAYTKTIDYLEAIKNNEKQIQLYRNTIKQAPNEIKQLRKKLQELEKQQDKKSTTLIQTNKFKKTSLLDLEQYFDAEAANLEAIKAKNNDLSQVIRQEMDSSPEIRTLLIEANHTLEQSLEDEKLAPSGATAEHKKANQWLLKAHIAELRSVIKKLDLQLLSQSERVQLLKLKKEVSDFHLEKIQKKVNLLKSQVDLKRSSEIQITQDLTREGQEKAQGKHLLIQKMAKLNAELSEVINVMTQKLIQVETGDENVYKETQRLSEEQVNTKKKLEIAGLSRILGQSLLEQKKALPDRKKYLKNLKKREDKIAELGLQHIQFQDELRKIKNKKDYLAEFMKEVPPEVQKTIEDDLLALIKIRKELLKKIIKIDESYLRAIEELDFAEKKLLMVAASYALLLDEHLLWLRSAPVLNFSNITDIPAQVAFFLLPSKWELVSKDIIHVLSSSIALIFGLLVVIALYIKRTRFMKLLVNTGKKTHRVSQDSVLHTFKALYYTLFLALPLPAVFLLLGWQLSRMIDVSDFSRDLADGLLFVIIPLFCLQFFRYLCVPNGVAEVHFKWSKKMTDNLSKEMGRLMVTLLPAIFITAVLISKGESSVNGGLGRLSLLVTLLTIAIFLYRLLKPKSGFLSAVADHSQGWFSRYQRFWFYLSILITVSLMVLTIAGYVYTAGQLTSRLIDTVWFIFTLSILQQMLLRWLLLTRRRYAQKVANEKHKLAKEKQFKQAQQSDRSHEGQENMPDIEEEEVDMVSLSEDTNQLLNLLLFLLGVSGLIAIWINLLPALGIFEQVTLWHYSGVENGVEKMLPITLGSLALAALIAVLTIVGGKRLPAIIEIVLIQYTAVSSGSRYTITTLINYSIIGIGFFSIFNILGADWARFQWLFAALSVGIGFGLQEIVANFISGIIILFERPIRVGDYVTVGDNEGTVSRIQIRATTIMTRDRKELLVPNKEFITGQLLNWSLSDPTARLIIPVGVAYGSDIPQARKLLLEAAQENQRVSEDPKPRVLFFNFGDNTLDLQLRCFIPNMDYRLVTISEINEAINDKFNAAGISIAFPQRDIHLDIKQPIDIRLQDSRLQDSVLQEHRS